MAAQNLPVLRPIFRPLIALLRETPLGIRQFHHPGPAQVVLLPAYGRSGAALLRIYTMAPALRALGWQVQILPWRLSLAQRRRWLDHLAPDVVIMQGTRHALNRPGLYPGQRILLDLDDGDFHLPHLVAPLREAMPQVTAVLAGSGYIADWCRRAGARATHILWTGAPVSPGVRPLQAMRPPVVAWAQTRPMHYRAEARLVRRVMAELAGAHPGTILRLYDRRSGDDPAFAERFSAPGLKVEWRPQMGYARFLASLDDVAVGLAPLSPDDPFCRGKSFGKILAYFDRHVPVVASAFGEPRQLLAGGAGLLCGADQEWVAALTQLLDDAPRRQRLAEAGFATFQRRLSTAATAGHLAEILQGLGEKDLPVEKIAI